MTPDSTKTSRHVPPRVTNARAGVIGRGKAGRGSRNRSSCWTIKPPRGNGTDELGSRRASFLLFSTIPHSRESFGQRHRPEASVAEGNPMGKRGGLAIPPVCLHNGAMVSA